MSEDPARRLSPPEQRAAAEALRAGLALSGLDVGDLWRASIALDQDAVPPAELHRILQSREDAVRLTAHEHDVLAQALNDHFVERGDGHPVRYSTELRYF
ncbi:hypothetical protein [Pseudonocardia endophytica]|nr:hypothetical protein [Pseudonocardia endophytica]